jgi:hypothetical protein
LENRVDLTDTNLDQKCDLLTSNPQIAGYLAGQKTEPKEQASYSLIQFYQIPLAIFAAILALGGVFITFIGGVVDNFTPVHDYYNAVKFILDIAADL